MAETVVSSGAIDGVLAKSATKVPDGKEAWDAYFADGWPAPEAAARTNHEPHDQWRTIGPSAERDEERLRAIARARRVPAETEGGKNPT